MLRALGFNYSEEEYGDVSLWRVVKQFFWKHLSQTIGKDDGLGDISSFLPKEIETLAVEAHRMPCGQKCFHWRLCACGSHIFPRMLKLTSACTTRGV